MWHDVVNQMDVIAVGGGPSSLLLQGWEYKNLVGCGSVSRYLKLSKYCYGDITYLNDIPSEGEIISSERNFGDREGMTLFPTDIPFGGSSGGMTISTACLSLPPGSLIGLIGYDGFDQYGNPYDPPSYESHKKLMRYWINKNYLLVSLMPVSTFNDILIQWQQINALLNLKSQSRLY